MSASPYQMLLNEINSFKSADEPAKKEFRDAIRRIAKIKGVIGIERGERIEYAGEMLGRKVQRAVIRDRLQVRFGVSKTQAYRDIEESFELSHKPPTIGNQDGSNNG